MSARDDWAAGWHIGNEHGVAVVDIPVSDSDAQRGPVYDESVEEPALPAVDPGSDFDLEAWEDGFATGYAKATGGDGGGRLRSNPYPR